MINSLTSTTTQDGSLASPVRKGVKFAEDYQEEIESAKYVEGTIGMARGMFKKLRRLKTSYREGVLVINLVDGGSLSFYKRLRVSDLLKQRDGADIGGERTRLSLLSNGVSVRARVDEFVEPYQKPYLFIPADVPWKFHSVSESSFEIKVPPVQGKMDIRVELMKYGFILKKKLLTKLDDDSDHSSEDSIGVTDSPNKNSLSFLFWCNNPGELAVYAKAADSLDRNYSKNMSENKYFVIPKTKTRPRTAEGVQIAAQSALIGRTKSVKDIPQRRQSTIGLQEYRCFPLYCYPNTWMTKDDIVVELPRTTKQFHDLRLGTTDRIGSLKVEVLQCVGLPKLDQYSLTDAHCFIVCGSSTFVTDVIPENTNPCWLPRSRRACIMPIHNAYSQCFIGVFDYDGEKQMDDFAGRVVIDINRLHSGTCIDVTLPLRDCARVYNRKRLGSIRLRLQLDWALGGERAAMLSYLPNSLTAITKRVKSSSISVAPTTVKCPDAKSFHNIAITVYGNDMPGRYTKSTQNAVTREAALIEKMLFYHAKRTAMNIFKWKTPLLSAYLFCGWMHFLINDISLAPAFFVSLIFIFMVKNYLQYHCNSATAKVFGYRSIFGMTRMLMFNRDDHTTYDIPIRRALLGDSWKCEDHAEFPFSIGSVDQKVSSDEAAANSIWEAAQGENPQSSQGSEFDDDIDDDEEIFDEYLGTVGYSMLSPKKGRTKNPAPSNSMDENHLHQPKGRFPNQNVNIKSGSGNTIKGQIDRWHGKVQRANLFLFDDRVFIAEDTTDAKKLLKIDTGRNIVARKINPIMSRVIKTFDIEVSAFRAVFNIFFWKDPFLSYWAMVSTFAVMIVFLIFPWRAFFFLLGIFGLGPQNYFLVDWYHQKKAAKRHERELLSDSNKSPDGRQEKQPGSVNEGDKVSCGSASNYNNAISNSPLLFRNNVKVKPDGKAREVIVPSVPFRYNRFYDWPPDPALASIK